MRARLSRLRQPDGLGLLIGAGLALLALCAAWLGQAPLPASALARWGPVIVAAVIGYAAGRNAKISPWQWRELALVALLGAASGIVVAIGDSVRPALTPLAHTGLTALLYDGLPVLPAVLPAAFVARPGVVVVGLIAGTLARALGDGPDYTALALVQLPLIAAPAELLLSLRRDDRAALTLAAAGALVGLGSYIAARLFAPAAHAPEIWRALLFSALLYGGVVGWLVIRGRDRWSRRHQPE